MEILNYTPDFEVCGGIHVELIVTCDFAQYEFRGVGVGWFRGIGGFHYFG